MVDRYYPCLAPERARRHDLAFPVEYRPHGRNPFRSLHGGATHTLLFHLTQAVVSYYDLVVDPETADLSPIDYVESLVKDGIQNCVVIGDPASGFKLVVRDVAEKLKQAEADADQAKTDALNDEA